MFCLFFIVFLTLELIVKSEPSLNLPSNGKGLDKLSEVKSELSVLNSSKLGRIQNAEIICRSKLGDADRYPNCCSSIVSIFETEKLCDTKFELDKPFPGNNKELERELSEIKIYYDRNCNENEYNLMISRNITTEDVYNCMRFNELKSRSLHSGNLVQSSSMDELNFTENNNETVENQRVLQLSGWMNHFGLPSVSGNTILSQSINTEGSFMHSNTGRNCSPLLTLIFVRVCNSICNAHHDSSSGRSSIPIFCLRDCQPFAKFACLRGCRKFGCSVDIYTCMELMCQ
ncbi:hypothetical protein HWI79_1583 [Cryptosporidium felis]|nr:hypothetical protein HWI79_1583 [Cryptosporidium felis]